MKLRIVERLASNGNILYIIEKFEEARWFRKSRWTVIDQILSLDHYFYIHRSIESAENTIKLIEKALNFSKKENKTVKEYELNVED